MSEHDQTPSGLDPRAEPAADLDPAADADAAAALDPAADTTMFQAFVARADGDPAERGKPVGAPFRLATLAVGLAVFAGLVWLLLKL